VSNSLAFIGLYIHRFTRKRQGYLDKKIVN